MRPPGNGRGRPRGESGLTITGKVNRRSLHNPRRTLLATSQPYRSRRYRPAFGVGGFWWEAVDA